MKDILNKSDILIEIEQDIEQYDLILLIVGEFSKGENLAEKVCQSEAIRSTKRNIKIMSMFDISKKMDNITYRKLTEEEQEDLINLYFLYDFSDKFRFFSSKELYGSILNYIKTGYLTFEEVCTSMLL